MTQLLYLYLMSVFCISTLCFCCLLVNLCFKAKPYLSCRVVTNPHTIYSPYPMLNYSCYIILTESFKELIHSLFNFSDFNAITYFFLDIV